MSSPYSPAPVTPISFLSAGSIFTPPVHDVPGQAVQGGTTGEHYHLTEAQYLALLNSQAIGNPIYEPVMTSLSELILIDSGDCLVANGGSYAS